MNENQHDEIDLLYAIGKLKQILKNWIALAYSGLEYLIKLWYILLILILLGIGYAWYNKIDIQPNHEATMIVKVNYNLQDYVTNALEDLNKEIGDRDPETMEALKMDPAQPYIYGIEYEPIVDYEDILDDYEVNDRGLEILLRSVDFNDEEISAKDYFEGKYDLYEVKVTANKLTKSEEIENIFNYINTNELLLNYKNQVISSHEINIEENKASLSLINEILKSYAAKKEGPTTTSVEINPNASNLIEAKMLLQKQNTKLLNQMALSKEIASPLNKAHIVKKKDGLLSNKYIVYPILLVLAFMLFSYFRYLFFYFRQIARNHKS